VPQGRCLDIERSIQPITRRAQRPPARTGGFVHLAEDQHAVGQHARVAHVLQQFLALAAALADAGEDREALVLLGHHMDQLHHRHGLADAGAAEHDGATAGLHRV